MTNNTIQMTAGAVDYSRWIPSRSALPMVSARSVAFKSVYQEVIARLKWLCHTDHAVLLISASGTGGIEAVITNAFSLGDQVLVLSNGFFGDQLDFMAQAFGLNCTKIDFDWQRPYDIGTVAKFLNSDDGEGLKGVFAVHLETSTGIVNDIKAIGELLKGRELLFVVDAVSSLGTCEVQVDRWGIDALVSVSYKGLLSPPVLCPIVLSERFIAAMRDCSRSVHYFDLARAVRYRERSITPWTPAVPTILLLNESLKKLELIGLESHFEQCKKLADKLRNMLADLNLPLFGVESWSNGVTTVMPPSAIDVTEFISILEEEYGLIISGGLGKLKGKTMRFGHYGNITLSDLDYVRTRLADALRRHGCPTGILARRGTNLR